MDQTPATTTPAGARNPPTDSASPARAGDGGDPAAPPESAAEAPLADPGFRGRGRLRRRVRFLRKARELAYRDLGGLVFNLHRFGQRHDVLVIAKLTTLTHIDTELRTLEAALEERHPVTILREAGISACPRCAAIHSGDDRFCPNCGLSMSRRVELPVAGPPAGAGDGPAAYPQTGLPVRPSGAPVQAPAGSPSGAPLKPPAASPPSAPAATVKAPAGSPPASPTSPVPKPAAAPAEAPAASTGEEAPGRGERAPAKAPVAAPDGDQPTQVIRPPAPGK